MKYPVLNPKEIWTLWPLMALYFAGCGLAFVHGHKVPGGRYVFAGMALLGVALYLARPDSPLRRLRIKRSIVATTSQGAYVQGRLAWADPATLSQITSTALAEAEDDYFAGTGRLGQGVFDGQLISFGPGLPGGPHTPARHYVYSGAYVHPGGIQVQFDEGDSVQKVLNRVRYGALLRLDSRLRAHAMEQDHRIYLEGVPL